MSEPSNDLFGLDGKRVLVTGGTRGIGRAISLQLARAGADVIANYVRNEQAAEQLEVLASAEDLSIELARADLTGNKGMARLVEQLGERTLWGIVHSAATGVHGALEELTPRHFDWTFNVNVRAFFDLIGRLREHLERGGGVVAISSDGAVRALEAYSLVGASKGALESLSRHLAVELAETRGVRVNVVSPGAVPTDAWDAFPNKEQRLEDAHRATPGGELATPHDVAMAVQFLLSPAASKINGHTLVVDGGRRLSL